MNEMEILDRTIFVGGPPRSGTTCAIKILNLHPRIMAAIDDHVFECWGLYSYRGRSGLVQDLRAGNLNPEEAKSKLRKHLFRELRLMGAAPSPKTIGIPEIPLSVPSPSGSPRSMLDSDLIRHAFPLDSFSSQWFLCLKSPEISFVLPSLSTLFREAKFVLVYRPLIEIAESMFRLGNMVERFPVYHRRWRDEKGEGGGPVLPPGVPEEWTALWRDGTDFQRCAIYAAAYMKAIFEGARDLPPTRCFVYNHLELKSRPAEVFRRMAGFLGVETEGFGAAFGTIESFSRSVPSGLRKEFGKIERKLEPGRWEASLDALSRRVSAGSS